MISMKLVIMILIFNWIMPHMIIILVSLLPLLFMRRILLMWRVVNFLCLWIVKRMLCAMVILLNSFMTLLKIIMREEYMLVGIAIISSFLSVLKILKLCLFYLPMQVDSCSHKLFAHKIPMHSKCVRLKCSSHILHDALFMFQFLSFM